MQGRFCATHASPFYGLLCTLLADDVDAGGQSAHLLQRWTGEGVDRGRLGADVPALRLLGSLHRLVLERRAPELALFYPSVGGTADARVHRGVWPVLQAALVEHADELRAGLARVPQTNEVGRAVPLLGGLALVSAWTGGADVRLHEIGASAGLNLRADHFPVGPGLLLDPGPGGLPAAPAYRVVERRGADLHPVDPTTAEGRLTLTSYVWPDDTVRLERLRAALDVARTVPVDLRAESAADLVESLALVEGEVTVLWHSVMWQYVAEPERARVLAALGRLGARAGSRRRLAHLRFEPAVAGAGGHHEIRLTRWPGGGGDTLVGTAPAHGVPVQWVPRGGLRAAGILPS
jgi:hypothetical protein